MIDRRQLSGSKAAYDVFYICKQLAASHLAKSAPLAASEEKWQDNQRIFLDSSRRVTRRQQR